jgi:serine/threonine protein kinase|nr:serine/threonine-protein kinase [Kofleriaceae bacterium]
MIELPPGTPVGKYEIVRKIATGGMAEIYLSRARGTAGFEKLVVLKRILPHLASDPSFVQMFLDEARLAATLQHPNIADVYDVGDADGAYFFTMEFVHGQDVRTIRLAERARGQRVPLAIALSIVHGTLAALDYAHDRRGPDGAPIGLVHRDVSSSNVLVSYDGAIKLVDFGIARANSGQHKTRTGTLKGKIPYMSPEQARGQAMDRRSDLFSLGVVLYELTVGRRPFRGDSDFAILEKIVHVGATPPSQVVQGYPAELEAIVMTLLARDPAQRYATGEDAMHALEQVIARHQLWLSPKAVGKYMRGLFASQITAWERAVQQGVPLVDHLAATMAGQKHRSDLLTPPSAFPAVAPASMDDDDVVDDLGADVGDGAGSFGAEASRPVTRPIGPMPAMPAIAATPAMPAAPRSRAALWLAASFAVAAVAASVAAVLVFGGVVGDRGGDGAPSAAASAPVTTAPAASAPAASAPTAHASPTTTPVTSAPATSSTATTTASTTTTAPAVPAASATTAGPHAATPAHPATTSARHPASAHPATAPPGTPATTTTTPPANWDPNSPFLPGQ